MYTPSARLSPPRTPQRSPYRHKKGSSADYSDINLQDMSDVESEHVFMENDPSRRGSRFPGLDTARTLAATIRENRKYQIVMVAVLVILLITIPLAATSGNRNSDSNKSLDLNSNSLGATADGDFSGSTPSPSPSVTGEATSEYTDPDPEDEYECLSDRLSYQDPLQTEQFICSRNGRYIFGMDKDGRLIYRDTFTGNTEVYFEGDQGYYYILHEDGAFLVKDEDDEIRWAKVSTYRMEPDRNCLENYPCPYLHLHKDGMLVLNFIDEAGFWDTKNFKHTLFDLEWFIEQP